MCVFILQLGVCEVPYFIKYTRYMYNAHCTPLSNLLEYKDFLNTSFYAFILNSIRILIAQ